MERMGIDEIRAAADPGATCKEQIRRWKISYSRYCGSRRGGLYYEENIRELYELLKELED